MTVPEMISPLTGAEAPLPPPTSFKVEAQPPPAPVALPAAPELAALPLPEDSLTRLNRGRAEFVGALVNHGLISEEFAHSGALDEFGYELPEEGWVEEDSLIHTLVGDQEGFHHLPTALALGLDRMAASQLRDPKRPDKSAGDLRKAQKIKPAGTFRPNLVEINGTPKTESISNTMFPNEWSTEDVLRAIIEVAHLPRIEPKRANRTDLHEGVINGIKIRVLTDDETHKIVTAYPK